MMRSIPACNWHFFFGGLEGCRVHEGCDRYGPQIVLVGIDAVVVDVYILDIQCSWGRTSHRTQWPHLTLIKDHIDDEKVTVWELRGADVNFNQEHALSFLSMLPKCTVSVFVKLQIQKWPFWKRCFISIIILFLLYMWSIKLSFQSFTLYLGWVLFFF